MFNKKYYDLMEDEIFKFEDDIYRLAGYLINNIPEYFFSVPASSSGKYHPVGDLGEGGLVRHSIAVKKMLDHLFEPNGYYDMFTPREKDLLRLAALFHDCMKSGTQEDYEKNPHTKFLHPIMAANFIMYSACKIGFNYEDAKFIYDVVSSHMGQWNKQGDSILPKPHTPAQKVLHLADYLASRQDINIVVENENEEKPADTTDEGE